MQYKTYYVVRWKPEYLELLRRSLPGEEGETLELQTVIVSLTQGGFGEGVMDYSRSAKEKFLEREREIRQLNFGVTEEVFDTYFELLEPDDVADLDEDERDEE